MDLAQEPGSSTQNNNTRVSTRNNLNIDNVVSTQPELGPTPPDGGYGWVVLICAIITQIANPSIIYVYGVILLFLNLSVEYEENQVFKIYDRYIIIVPIMTTVFGLYYKEWGRTLVLITNRPRVVAISGVLLTSAGLLLSSFGADSEENDIIVTISAGLLIGVGNSLTTEQLEILLRHYFRSKLPMVLSLYKLGITIGNILIPLLMCALLTSHGASSSIVIYAALVLQQCFIILLLTRPTYIVQAMKQNYEVLNEEEDETIYSQTNQNNSQASTEGNANNGKRNKTDEVVNVNTEDQDDEYVIATFGNGKNTTSPTPNLVRYDTANGTQTTENPFGSNFRVNFDQIDRHDDPQTLYRATTVVNESSNDFTFSFDPPTSGTLRRTANTKRNFTVFLSILRDLRFYAYTILLLSYNYSFLVFGALFPAFLSQQLPTMDMMTVIGMVLVVQMGGLFLTMITTYVSFFKHKMVLRFSSLVAAFSFVGLASSVSRGSITIWGVLIAFSLNSLQVALRPIYKRTSTEFEDTAISQTSSIVAGTIISIIMIAHNHTYGVCFRIASVIHLFAPFLTYKY